ncbi:MAG: hypothetical protein ABI304_03050 [Rudaea sp.]
MIDDIDDAEWQRQEQARLAERAGLDPTNTDSRSMRYRYVARQLARDLDAPLPSTFAYAGSTRIEAIARQQRRERTRFERAAFTWLAAVAGVGACIALAVYGREWWSAIERAGWLHSHAVPWLIVIAVCGLLSRLFAGTLRSAHRIKH